MSTTPPLAGAAAGPAANPGAGPILGGGGGVDDAPSKIQRELLVKEYENCINRYENIYKALWQNLSYLSVLSAAILTFASPKFHWSLVVVIAGLPLLFWYLVQFWPLDLYGRLVRHRTAEIERTLNHLYFTPAQIFQHEGGDIRVGMEHWIDFAGPPSTGFVGWRVCKKIWSEARAFWTFVSEGRPRPIRPVAIRSRMLLAFIVFFAGWLAAVWEVLDVYRSGGPDALMRGSSPSAQEVKIGSGEKPLRVEFVAPSK